MSEQSLKSIWPETPEPEKSSASESRVDQQTLVVVGSGPVGLSFVRELTQRGFRGSIYLYGDEPWRPYNRIQLSSLLAGELRYDDLLYPEINAEEGQFHFINRRIQHIDLKQQIIKDDRGQQRHFDALVIATGSRPWVPGIEGADLKGVFVFRDLSDAQHLLARSVRTRCTVVVGGGLLGVEAARGMQRNNTKVLLVHQSNRLMNRQLDVEAGAILKRSLEGYGIEVYLNSGLKRVLGKDQVTGVELRNGQIIDCDTVIFSTGIQPNVEIARQAGIGVGRGVQVNDGLETSQPNVYAIGECAEHNNEIYGLLAPGLEQAAVLADRLCEGDAKYHGSIAATQLKILDLPIFTVGWISDEYENLIDQTVMHHTENGEYRKLFLKRGRLKGVVAVGECDERSRLQQAVVNEQRILPWQIRRFKVEGRIWPEEDSQHVREWPASAIVCNCRGVTKGTLVKAQLEGCQSVTALAEETGASTVCGSCEPLLADLTGSPFTPEPVLAAGKPLMAVVILSLLVGLFTLVLPTSNYAEQFNEISWLQKFWTDSLLKQVTGFTLLGISVFAVLISLRKRVKRVTLGTFPWWRFIHTVLGLIALFVLYLHTGFSLGEHLNRYLMTDFVLLAIVGAVAGFLIGQERLRGVGYSIKRMRSWSTHAHIILFWPLPILLGFHVLSVYFF